MLLLTDNCTHLQDGGSNYLVWHHYGNSFGCYIGTIGRL